ncbi:MAG: hypothetical protein AB7U38_14895 [Hyphomicrobiales bacterium]
MAREQASGLLDGGFERWLEGLGRHLTGSVTEFWDDERRKPARVAASVASVARIPQG